MIKTADNFNSLHRGDNHKSNVIITNHYASPDIVFLDARQLSEKMGCSLRKVYQLFKDPDFPAIDLGKKKVVEVDALRQYFSVRRDSMSSAYWKENM